MNISREWEGHRTPIQKMRVSGVYDMYFLGTNLVAETETGSIIAMYSQRYTFHRSPHFSSHGDRITALASYKEHIVAVG